MHILQTVPPSNINRDDTGSPKTAIYGGVTRARVSSQAWKRATRTMFGELLDPATLGVRTKHVVELIAHHITALSPEFPTPEAAALEVVTAAGIKVEKPQRRTKAGSDRAATATTSHAKDETVDASPTDGEDNGTAAPEDAASGKTDAIERSKYLLFLSASQIDRLARLAVHAHQDDAGIDKGAARAAAQGDNSVDVALFGRMVADANDLSIDAAAQVAHAISVHAVNNEFDYFTAVDDRAPQDNVGAGMLGFIEFNSSTLYRYATVNVPMLAQNLGNAAATEKAVQAFLTAFVKSMPTGKQNTFAHRTLPETVVFSVRTDQPVNLVGAFEEPINAAGIARATLATKALVSRLQSVEHTYGDGSTRTFVVATGDTADELESLGTPLSLKAAVDAVVEQIQHTLGGNE
ncbi:type I-E CRISPR-associated protein Cas7/Cse4/CasC [Nocardia sp. NPDC052001]|uniref:type I-E CRISPR-associated protein Cas7/Cse4/CasC n=1 Tax=Nocardia sp. NPDC052001 TaxID=3154853 RepID=UPI00342E3997